MIKLVIASVGLFSLQPILFSAHAQIGMPGAAILDSANAPGLSEMARAVKLAAAIPVLMNHGTPDGLAAAERVLSRMDSLSSAVTVQKIIGHQHLLKYYRAVDNDGQIYKHASRILALAPKLNAEERQQDETAIIAAYTSLAAVYGDQARADRAVTLLRRGIAALASLPNAKAALDPVLTRYAQVGKRGAVIQAQHWFNIPSGKTRYTPDGAVTLVEFTAHWCGPCRKSYPAVARLQHAYGSRGMQSLFVTTTYGFFEKEKDITPAQEASYDSVYYLTRHEMPVQVAVYETPETSSGAPPAMPNETAYNVSGIPQLVLLDRAGVIRMIVVGWDPATEAHLKTMIETLLSETRVPVHAHSSR